MELTSVTCFHSLCCNAAQRYFYIRTCGQSPREPVVSGVLSCPRTRRSGSARWVCVQTDRSGGLCTELNEFDMLVYEGQGSVER